MVGPDPTPMWDQHWRGSGQTAVGVPDPSRQVAALYRQERRMMFWLPAVFIIDRRGRLRYARYGATLRNTPLNETLLAELARINRRAPREAPAAPAVVAEHRAALAAGAAAFVGWLPEAWTQYLQAATDLGATQDEWLAAILAHATGDLAGHALADRLVSGPWLSPESLQHADGAHRAALDALALAAGVQDRMVLLVRLLEIKDPYTAGHSERVGALASAIGMRLTMTPDDVEDLAIAGLLHDIGKVVVPTHILGKPGRLLDAEFARMRVHPVASEALISHFTPLGRICPPVRHHHENWSGGGYPDGISGEAIPLGGRILAVCDAYDAMTSARPYRDAMTRDRAIAIMAENARGQWEPQLVEHLRAVLALGQPVDAEAVAV